MHYLNTSAMTKAPIFDKDFYDSYSPLIPTLKVLGYLAQGISALTEYGVIYAMTAQSVEPFFGQDTYIVAHLGAVTGTLFLEVGLRRFLPFSFQAVLHKRYQGLHLVLSCMVLTITLLLLLASGTLSFYGSHSIVRHFSPPAPPMSETPVVNQHAALRSAAYQRWSLDSVLIEQKHRALYREVQSKTGTQLSWSDRTRQWALIEQQRVQSLGAALEKRDQALEKAEQGLKASLQHIRQDNLSGQKSAQAQVKQRGNNLGWFTVLALVVLIGCVGIEETYRKGCGSKPVGLWAEFWDALQGSWYKMVRGWIRYHFPETPLQVEPEQVQEDSQSCAHCGGSYVPNRCTQRFCSKDCRLHYHAGRHNGKVFLPGTYHKRKRGSAMATAG